MATVLVTGASSGIGLELCRYYIGRGDEVIAACRETNDALAALPIRVIDGVDVATAAGPERLKAALAGERVDVLINNAGVLANDTLGSIDADSVVQQFLVNALGPLRVTEALLDNLRAGSKVALVTSRMGSMADNTSGAYYGYRMSKAALNAAGVSLARDLASRGVAVAMLHPGFVQTRMVGFAGDISPEESARRLAARIDELTLETSNASIYQKEQIVKAFSGAPKSSSTT
jgi:NAD(P)-dependent dehydrogenase (short-subunit alcohol dehydrogenase family)